MQDFESLDPKAPATLENVVRAIEGLLEYDEVGLVGLASAGRLPTAFPFRLAIQRQPEDSLDPSDVAEASALPPSEDVFSQYAKAGEPGAGKGLGRFFQRGMRR